DVQQWIDQHTKRPENLEEVIDRLTAWTLPVKPWLPTKHVNPLLGDLDGQFWLWNRAGGNLVDGGYPDAAAKVWSASYLVYLCLQSQFQHRYHKGMPLCNMGYASARSNQKELAKKSWLLGLVEEALTVPDTYSDSLNYQNLQSV